MLGVPLSGGKTLNVTFRSLNTRGDIFKTYNHQAGSPRRAQSLIAPEIRTPPNTTNRNVLGATRMGLVTGPVVQYTVNNKIVTSERTACESPITVPKKEHLAKAVQLGVMRGLSTTKDARKSRTMNAAEKTYMQLKMRSDGVVPFQNTIGMKGVGGGPEHAQFVKPLYLTGMNTFQTGPFPVKPSSTNASPQRKQKRCEIYNQQQQMMQQDPRSSLSPALIREQHKNVSQMGSQTSTDKFVEGDAKNTQTNHSINETFELTNMIGGASIEVPLEISAERRQRAIDQQEARPTTQKQERAKNVGSHKPNSKMDVEESIDQPSFQTEHEATFLWNNAKINHQNSLSNNSRFNYDARSPTDNRDSYERNSFQESIMGAKPSHNLSLDSRGKPAQIIESNQQYNEQYHAQTHRVREAPKGIIVGQSINLTGVHTSGHSPQQLRGAEQNVDKAMMQAAAQRRATQNYKKTTDMIQLSASAYTDQTRQSRPQMSARESIKERIKQVTMNLPIPVSDQLGPVQGHSMQLVKTGDRSGRAPNSAVQQISPRPSQKQQSQPNIEQDSASIREYGAMILAQGQQRSIASSDIGSQPDVSTPGKTRISVDDFQGQSQTPLSQKRLTKIDTQVRGNLETIHAHCSEIEKGAELTSDHVTFDQDIHVKTTIEMGADQSQPSYNQIRQSAGSPLIIEGHANQSEGGVKIGRFNTVLTQPEVRSQLGNLTINVDEKSPSECAEELQTDLALPPLSASPVTPPIDDEHTNLMPKIACSITASNGGRNGSNGCDTKIVTVVKESNATSELVLTKQETQILTLEGIEELNKTLKVDASSGQKQSQYVKAIPTQLLILKKDDGPPTKPTKVTAGATQTSYPSFELHSVGLRNMNSFDTTQQSIEGSPLNNDEINAPTFDNSALNSLFGDDNLTNMALHNQIGTLALTFPNSQVSKHFKRVMSPHEQNLMQGRPNKRGPKHNLMQIKPDLANVKPEELDDGTIRNMNAIGINFATQHTNRLKPFESRASKKRKWRNNFESDRNSVGKAKLQNEIADYDGSRSDAEKIKILQRRLTAWPTFELASGFGSEPTRVVGTVGTTTNSNAIDQSYMLGTDLFGTSKPGTSGTNQTLDMLPADVRNIQTPGAVKSAVGCSRVVARIHLKRLLEQSHVNTQTQGLPMMVDPVLRERALQTQGCQRTSHRIENNHPQTTNVLQSQIAAQKTVSAKRSSISTSRDVDTAGLQTIQNKIRHQSMVATCAEQQNNASPDTSGQGFDHRKRSKTLASDEFGESESPAQINRPKFASFSLELRRRTDQQVNYMSRTVANWKNAPIGVEDQTHAELLQLHRPQRSIDISESFTNSKVKVRAKMQLGTGQLKDNSSIMNDLMTDSIRASRNSIQLKQLQMQQNSEDQLTTIHHKKRSLHIGHPGHIIDFEPQKFDLMPKTACVSHRMKGFCCRVPDKLQQGRLPYQNNLTQRAGLSPKAPILHHGLFGPSRGPSQNGSVNSKQVFSAGKQQEKHARPQLKQFIRPMVTEAAKCQVTLHESLENAIRKTQRAYAPKIQISEDEKIKNRVNRADLRQIHNYKNIRNRVQSLHVPKLLHQFQQSVDSPVSSGQVQTQLQKTLNDPNRVNAYAVLYFRRDKLPGSLNGRKLHTSQLSTTPEMQLDIMLPGQNN